VWGRLQKRAITRRKFRTGYWCLPRLASFRVSHSKSSACSSECPSPPAHPATANASSRPPTAAHSQSKKMSAPRTRLTVYYAMSGFKGACRLVIQRGGDLPRRGGCDRPYRAGFRPSAFLQSTFTQRTTLRCASSQRAGIHDNGMPCCSVRPLLFQLRSTVSVWRAFLNHEHAAMDWPASSGPRKRDSPKNKARPTPQNST
jgi:hypothetical protein